MHRSQTLKARKSESGFTLVELSIVLVIIGLIVSSVLVGQDLVRTAAIRNVIAQRDSFDAAVFTFRSRYNTLPGDGNTVAVNLSCSGNGDGLLSLSSATQTAIPAINAVATVNTADSGCFWNVLGQGANSAGYIPGVFSGNAPAASNANIASIQPVSKLNGLYWAAFSNSATSVNYYFLGVSYTTAIPGANAAIDGVTALNIDTKIDDGAAATGTIMAYATSTTQADGTATAAYAATTNYALRFRMQSM